MGKSGQQSAISNQLQVKKELKADRYSCKSDYHLAEASGVKTFQYPKNVAPASRRCERKYFDTTLFPAQARRLCHHDLLQSRHLAELLRKN